MYVILFALVAFTNVALATFDAAATDAVIVQCKERSTIKNLKFTRIDSPAEDSRVNTWHSLNAKNHITHMNATPTDPFRVAQGHLFIVLAAKINDGGDKAEDSMLVRALKMSSSSIGDPGHPQKFVDEIQFQVQKPLMRKQYNTDASIIRDASFTAAVNRALKFLNDELSTNIDNMLIERVHAYQFQGMTVGVDTEGVNLANGDPYAQVAVYYGVTPK